MHVLLPFRWRGRRRFASRTSRPVNRDCLFCVTRERPGGAAHLVTKLGELETRSSDHIVPWEAAVTRFPVLTFRGQEFSVL